MISINQIMLAGYLGQDPEVKTFNDGGKLVTLQVCTKNRWTARNGETKERSQWHCVVLKNENDQKFATQYLRKGAGVLVLGEMEYREFSGKNGEKVKKAEVVVGFGGKLQASDRSQASQGDDARGNGRGDYDDYGQSGNDGRQQNGNGGYDARDRGNDDRGGYDSRGRGSSDDRRNTGQNSRRQYDENARGQGNSDYDSNGYSNSGGGGTSGGGRSNGGGQYNRGQSYGRQGGGSNYRN